MFQKYDTPYDMNFKLYSALSSGAKGLVYWQYRAERVGHESDCSGIMYMDGTPRPVAYEVKDFGAELNKSRENLVGSEAAPADVAIVFDFNSSLISEIDDSIGPDFTFDWCNPKFYYRYAHAGMYRLLRDRNYRVDYVGVTRPECFKNYKVLYFPYYTMLDPEIVPYLESFLENGGKIIADEGFGMRTPNTWMQPYDIDCKPLMTARLRHRRVSRGETVEYAGKVGMVRPYVSNYEVQDAKEIATLSSGVTAIREIKHGKGSFYLCSFSLGYCYMMDNGDIWADIVEDLIDGADVAKYPYADVKGEIYEKRLEKDGEEIIFIFNSSEEEKRIEIAENAVSVGGSGTLEGKTLVVPAKTTAYVIAKK
jgi:beta-galactosidase